MRPFLLHICCPPPRDNFNRLFPRRVYAHFSWTFKTEVRSPPGKCTNQMYSADSRFRFIFSLWHYQDLKNPHDSRNIPLSRPILLEPTVVGSRTFYTWDLYKQDHRSVFHSVQCFCELYCCFLSLFCSFPMMTVNALRREITFSPIPLWDI